MGEHNNRFARNLDKVALLLYTKVMIKDELLPKLMTELVGRLL
jgi:hypothetical protein